MPAKGKGAVEDVWVEGVLRVWPEKKVSSESFFSDAPGWLWSLSRAGAR